MFGMLDLNLDFFYNLRKGILVETQGSISKAIGVELPYSSKGEVKNMGMDLGPVSYTHLTLPTIYSV